MLFTESKNLFSFRSYRNLNFGSLGQLLIKKTEKIENWDILRKTYLVPQNMSDLAEIWSRASLYMPQEPGRSDFENFEKF